MTSPIGYYTEEILHDLGIYNLVADKIIYAKSTREIVAEDDTEVIYGIAVAKNSSKKQEAMDFINYLYSEKSITVLTYYGFDVIK